MEKKKKEYVSQATIKKAFKKAGGSTQKMVSFRCDNELLQKLQAEVNKGRLINRLLHEHYGV